MAFNSISFILFLIGTIVIYFLLPKRCQWIVLLIASYLYYYLAAGSLVVFILFTTISTFFTGLLLDKVNAKYENILRQENKELSRAQKKQYQSKKKKEKRVVLITTIIVNFGILAFIKYYDFMTLNISSLFSTFHIDFSFPSFSFLLPVGISFYTFQSMGYIIDVYRGKIKADRNMAKFSLFVSFFPQIIQGPISRYDTLAHQLYSSHEFDYSRVKFGLQLILWGLYKKMVIADRVVIMVDSIFSDYLQYGGFINFIGAALYSLQVYCDFSGGVDIARGIAQIFGIDLPDNFKRPFFATSIEDFWRRWHITLSSWTRDYIFYPLSLSKSFTKLGRTSRKFLGTYFGKLIPTFLAMLITFITVGIWHGPDWKFIVYGAYNGFLIFLGIMVEPAVNQIIARLHIKTNVFSWRLFKIAGTFFLVTIGRYFSRADSLMIALSMLKRTFLTYNPWVLIDGALSTLGLDNQDITLLSIAILVLFIVDFLQEKGIPLRQRISEQNLVFRWILYLAIIFTIIIFGIYGIQYKGSDFIYRGF